MGKEEFYGLQYPQMKIDYDFSSQFLIGKVEPGGENATVDSSPGTSSQFLIGKV